VKQSSSLLKIAVILSAVLLVSAFVSCRAGTPWFKKANTRPAESGNEEASSQEASSDGSQTVLGGSKSAIVMSSSKSGGVVRPDSGLDSSVWDLDILMSDSDAASPPETTDAQAPPPPQ